MTLIPKDQIVWKKVRYLKMPLEAADEQARWYYELWLNEPLASWDVFPYWERERVFSMMDNLKFGDVLFDIGTEQGWCDLVYAKIVGPKNMVLVEPTPEFWPNIKALWHKNYPDIKPRGFYDGFFSDKTTESRLPSIFNDWPASSEGDLIDRNSYRYLSDEKHILEVPQMTIDDYVSRTGIFPDALTIDTEGAELLILRGAIQTINFFRPKIWVSEHDDLQLKNFRIRDNEIADFMKKLGYSRKVLSQDHERHCIFLSE